MKVKSITSHLKPYRMIVRRRTTVNHMFAAAVAPYDDFNEARVRAAVTALGNDPDDDLACAYCGSPAETWDHIFATVQESRFSGHGHRLGNLLPCCHACNSRKGSMPWKDFISSLPINPATLSLRVAAISFHIDAYGGRVEEIGDTDDHRRMEDIRRHILALMQEADDVARRIRAGATHGARGEAGPVDA